LTGVNAVSLYLLKQDIARLALGRTVRASAIGQVPSHW
jgi:hypothetical protein